MPSFSLPIAAKRLGAVVEVTDVRPETKEQVESLGGRFLSVEGAEEVKVEGGYAKEVSADFLQIIQVATHGVQVSNQEIYW